MLKGGKRHSTALHMRWHAVQHESWTDLLQPRNCQGGWFRSAPSASGWYSGNLYLGECRPCLCLDHRRRCHRWAARLRPAPVCRSLPCFPRSTEERLCSAISVPSRNTLLLPPASDFSAGGRLKLRLGAYIPDAASKFPLPSPVSPTCTRSKALDKSVRVQTEAQLPICVNSLCP